jgi:hypothetical protein
VSIDRTNEELMTGHKFINSGEPPRDALKAAIADAVLANEEYAPLRRVLDAAYDQSARGKGKERHARGKPFLEQPIMEIARMVGLGYQTGQLMKKAQEATAMAARQEFEAAQAEMLGVIVYAAAGYLMIEEQKRREKVNAD